MTYRVQDPRFSVTNFSRHKLLNGSEILPRAARSVAHAQGKMKPWTQKPHGLKQESLARNPESRASFSVIGNRREKSFPGDLLLIFSGAAETPHLWRPRWKNGYQQHVSPETAYAYVRICFLHTTCVYCG